MRCPVVSRRNSSKSLIPDMVPSRQALLRSQSDPGAHAAFSVTPSSALTRIESHLFRVLLQRRLHLRLLLSNRICGCCRRTDSFGDHCAVCGLRASARKLAPVWCQTCWSATWTWQCLWQAMLDAGGESNLQPTRLWCQHRGDGNPRRGSDTRRSGAVRGKKDKEPIYPGLVGTGALVRMVVLALEGWWSVGPKAIDFVSQLTKARYEPFFVRRRMEQAWPLRWTGRARPRFRCLLVGSPRGRGADGFTPKSHQVECGTACARMEGNSELLAHLTQRARCLGCRTTRSQLFSAPL